MRRIHRSDLSQPEIVDALRKAGASVYCIGRPVDLLIGFRRQTFIAECKTPNTQYGKKLSKSQQEFADNWRGGNVLTLWDATDAIRLLNTLTHEAETARLVDQMRKSA